MKKERYTFGYTDTRAVYGDPKIKWEPIRASRRYDWGLAVCYAGVAVGVSMTVAPMAWVKLFQWMVS